MIFCNAAIVLTFLVGFLLYAAKLKFVMKILAANTQVKVFNHSLTLCLLASGDNRLQVWELKESDKKVFLGLCPKLFFGYLPLLVFSVTRRSRSDGSESLTE